jgi:hypothetical protein
MTDTSRTATVRKADDDDEAFVYFGEHPYDVGHHTDMVIVRRPHLDGCLASDLESALAPHDEPDAIFITDDDEKNYSEEESDILAVSFDISRPQVAMLLEFRIPPWAWEGDNEPEEAIETLVQRVLHTHGLSVDNVDVMSGRSGILRVDYEPRDRPLGGLVRAGEDVIALIDASNGATLTLATATSLIKNGRLPALIGQPEGPWFDAKEMHYAIGTAKGKISLAQSVARFCNGGEGGIIVVGLKTSTPRGTEVVDKLTPVAYDPSQAPTYRKIIDQYLYPFPTGLNITVIPTDDRTGMFILIAVPQQPEYNKPFLVAGAIVDDHVYGGFISIVQRRDENSEPIKPAMIHAWIAAGRALMQRGEIPGDTRT